MRGPADLRAALLQQTREVAEAASQLLDLGTAYHRAASSPEGEPNRVNEASLALERTREELLKAVDCYARPGGER